MEFVNKVNKELLFVDGLFNSKLQNVEANFYKISICRNLEFCKNLATYKNLNACKDLEIYRNSNCKDSVAHKKSGMLQWEKRHFDGDTPCRNLFVWMHNGFEIVVHKCIWTDCKFAFFELLKWPSDDGHWNTLSSLF